MVYVVLHVVVRNDRAAVVLLVAGVRVQVLGVERAIGVEYLGAAVGWRGDGHAAGSIGVDVY